MNVEKQQWLEERRNYLGGSDAAAVLGLSKWKTPYQLWLEKTGQANTVDETWEMSRGKAMEPLLRQHYSDVTGRRVSLPHSVILYNDHSFIGYNPDGLCLEERRLQEFKTAARGEGWGEEGTDEIPQEYLLQVQQGMLVTGYEVTDVTVSIAGNKPKFFEVFADQELQEMIVTAEQQFWQMVQTGVEPLPISNEDVARRYRQVNGNPIAADDHIRFQMASLKELKANIKDLESKKEHLEVEIKNFMGGNELLIDTKTGLTMATWKEQAGARRINADLLRSAYPEVAAAVTTQGDPLRRFLVK